MNANNSLKQRLKQDLYYRNKYLSQEHYVTFNIKTMCCSCRNHGFKLWLWTWHVFSHVYTLRWTHSTKLDFWLVLYPRPDVEDTGSLGLLWYADDKGEDKDERLAVQPATSSRQKREDLQDPDYQIPSRLQILELPRDDHKYVDTPCCFPWFWPFNSNEGKS